jgi:hypothetical protein
MVVWYKQNMQQDKPTSNIIISTTSNALSYPIKFGSDELIKTDSGRIPLLTINKNLQKQKVNKARKKKEIQKGKKKKIISNYH